MGQITTLKRRSTTANKKEIESKFCKGCRELGDGAFANVYQHPTSSKRVIKVATDDSAYSHYLRCILKHQNNPFFPHIYSATQYVNHHDHRFLVVEMEKLEEDTPRAIWFTELMWKGMDDHSSGYESYVSRQFKAKKLPTNRMRHFDTAWSILQPLLKRYSEDLHEGNIMFRGNQPVITDPVA